MNPGISNRDGRHAFTLIELMIVIVLVGILAAMIIPEMKSGYEDALLRSTGRNLVNAFSIASSRAVSMNELHRVRLDSSKGRYVIEKRVREGLQGDEFTPLKDVSEAEGTLDPRISIRIHSVEEEGAAPVAQSAGETGGEPAPTVDSVSFNADGTADATELVLRDKQGYRLLLHINPITSHVKVAELERE
jgi:prepilin-type N-terminal cleavage/methylation domain-containing protein